MSYVNVLKNMREKLSQEVLAPVEAPAPKQGRGFFSSPVKQQEEVAPQYDPNSFLMENMRQIKASRQAFSEKMQMSAKKSGEAFTTHAKRGWDELYEPTINEDRRQPTREIIESVKDRDIEAVTQEPGNKDITTNVEFIDKVKSLASKYGTTPQALLAVMHFETGGSFSSGTKNAAGSGATGLIQFMPSTAKGMGTTTEALAKLSPVEQLDWVDKYFAQTPLSRNTENSVEDVYMSVLYPKAVGKPSDYVLFEKGTKAYTQNAGLDPTGKGYVTKADAAYKVKRFLGAYTNV